MASGTCAPVRSLGKCFLTLPGSQVGSGDVRDFLGSAHSGRPHLSDLLTTPPRTAPQGQTLPEGPFRWGAASLGDTPVGPSESRTVSLWRACEGPFPDSVHGQGRTYRALLTHHGLMEFASDLRPFFLSTAWRRAVCAELSAALNPASYRHLLLS